MIPLVYIEHPLTVPFLFMQPLGFLSIFVSVCLFPVLPKLGVNTMCEHFIYLYLFLNFIYLFISHNK